MLAKHQSELQGAVTPEVALEPSQLSNVRLQLQQVTEANVKLQKELLKIQSTNHRPDGVHQNALKRELMALQMSKQESEQRMHLVLADSHHLKARVADLEDSIRRESVQAEMLEQMHASLDASGLGNAKRDRLLLQLAEHVHVRCHGYNQGI